MFNLEEVKVILFSTPVLTHEKVTVCKCILDFLNNRVCCVTLLKLEGKIVLPCELVHICPHNDSNSKLEFVSMRPFNIFQ